MVNIQKLKRLKIIKVIITYLLQIQHKGMPDNINRGNECNTAEAKTNSTSIV